MCTALHACQATRAVNKRTPRRKSPWRANHPISQRFQATLLAVQICYHAGISSAAFDWAQLQTPLCNWCTGALHMSTQLLHCKWKRPLSRVFRTFHFYLKRGKVRASVHRRHPAPRLCTFLAPTTHMSCTDKHTHSDMDTSCSKAGLAFSMSAAANVPRPKEATKSVSPRYQIHQGYLRTIPSFPLSILPIPSFSYYQFTISRKSPALPFPINLLPPLYPVLSLASLHFSKNNANSLLASISLVRDTPCPKWHVDRVKSRAIATLVGVGTQLRPEDEIIQLDAGDVVIMSGSSQYDEDGGVWHRSPPNDALRIVISTTEVWSDDY